MILRMNFLLFGLIIFLSTFATVLAQDGSGACSWHGGVNCSAGWQPDGTAICKDGTKGSEVQYSDLLMCQKELTLHTILTAVDFAYNNHTYIQPEKSTLNWDVVQDQCEREMYQNARYVERSKNCIDYTNNVIKNAQLNPTCPSNSEKFRSGPGLDNVHCRCVEGYYNYPIDSYSSQGYCSAGAAPMTQEEQRMMLLSNIEREIININARASERVMSPLNTNYTDPGIPKKKSLGATSINTNPDESCKKMYGVNGKYLYTEKGVIKCGCTDDYSLGRDGLCSWAAPKTSNNNSHSLTSSSSSAYSASATLSDNNYDSENKNTGVWLWAFFLITMISLNGLRIYFKPKIVN